MFRLNLGFEKILVFENIYMYGCLKLIDKIDMHIMPYV